MSLKKMVKGKKMVEVEASHDEIRAAWNTLSEVEVARLRKFAESRARGLERRGGPNYSADALFAEAVTRILEGRKKWKRDQVSFFTFFYLALKNISGHWNKHLKSGRAEFEARNGRVDDFEGETDGVDLLPSPELNSEAYAIRKEELTFAAGALLEIKAQLQNNTDQDALDVLDGWESGMSPAEIQEALGLTRTACETIQTRLLRTIRKTLNGRRT